MWFCNYEWIAFYGTSLNIHRGGVLTALAWLVPYETAAVSAKVLCTPYNHAPYHFMQSHIRKVHPYLACNLPPALLAEWRGILRATAVTRGWNGNRNKSTESWPWRRKFSRRSCRDSNPRPFDHESGALTTKLSPLPCSWCHSLAQGTWWWFYASSHIYVQTSKR